MLYNKSKNRKVNDKKVLHKIRKKWVVVSSALLMALGGYAAVTHTSAVHADVNGDNATNRTVNSNQDSTGQLTNNASKSLNSQKQNSQTSAVTNNKITDQARQLHSQIIQNSVKTSASQPQSNEAHVNNQTSSATHKLSNSAVQPSSSINVATSTVNQRPKRALGYALPASDVGYVSIIYRDVDKSDQNFNHDVGEQNNAQAQALGTPFTQSDKNMFIGEPPKGYTYDSTKGSRIIQNVQSFSKTPQDFIIGVVPVNKTSQSDVRNRIVIEYEDDTAGNQMVNKPDSDHWTYSDKSGKPFGLLGYETNIQQDYDLDMNSREEISTQLTNGHIISDETFSPLDPQFNVIKFKPGVTEVQIRVAPKAKMNISYVDVDTNSLVDPRNNMTHYTVQGAVGNSFNVTPFESSPRMPNGYSFANKTANVPSKYMKGQQMTIYITKNGSKSNNNKPNQGPVWVTVDYVDQSDGNQIQQIIDAGKADTPLNYSKYESNTPIGYRYNGIINGMTNYDPANPDEIVKVGVSKKPNSTNQPANETVDYTDANSGKLIGYQTAQGSTATPFPSDVYKNKIPNGYHFVRYNGNVPSNYANVTIDMEVAKNMGKMPVTYINKTNNQTVGHVDGNDNQGPIGIIFNPSKLEQSVSQGGYLPMGFTFDSFAGGQPTAYSNNPITIYVNPISTNNNGNNNQKPQTRTVNVPVKYYLNGQYMGPQYDAKDLGNVGTTFNSDNYTKFVPTFIPSGYKFDNIIGTEPQVYGDNEALELNYVQVPHNNSDNSHKGNDNRPQQRIINVPVKYYLNGQYMGAKYDAQDTGVSGTTFNSDNYTKFIPAFIPSGYEFNNVIGVEPQTYGENESLNLNYVPVKHNSNNNNNNNKHNDQTVTVNVPVKYYVNGRYMGKQYDAQDIGQVGKPFNSDNYTKFVPSFMPSGYEFGNVIGVEPQTYGNNEALNLNYVPINPSSNGKGNQDQEFSMPVDYVYNNQVIAKAYTPKAKAGASFDPTNYENLMPKGYEFVGYPNNNPMSYAKGQSITINVKPIPQPNHQASKVQMSVRYISNGKVVGTNIVSGINGTPFDPTWAEDNVPNNYKYDGGNVNKPQNYEPNGSVDIYVDPINTSHVVKMPIYYDYKGQSVGINTAVGMSGTPITSSDLGSYEQNVASGYKYNNGAVKHPQDYTSAPGQAIVIPVIPLQPSDSNQNNKGNQATQGTIIISYINDQNGQTIDNLPLYGQAGQLFTNLNHYESLAPANTRFDKIISGGNINRFNSGVQSIQLGVKPVSKAPSVKNGSIMIYYRDVTNGNYMLNNNNLTESTVGSAFDWNKAERDLPIDYHFVGVYKGNNVSQYTTSPQMVVLNVAPDNQNNNANNNNHGSNTNQNNGHNSQPVTPQYGTITIQCVDPSGQNVGVSNTTNNKVGTPFNLSTALRVANIPSSYHIVGLLSGNNVSQYTAGNQFVDVEVAPNQSTSASSSATSANVNPNPQSQSSSSTNAGNVNPQPTDNNNTANPSFNPNFDPSFNPVINNTVPQSHNNGSASANPINNNRSNGYVPNSNVAQPTSGSTNNSNDPVHFASNNTNGTSTSQQTPNNTVSHRNTQGANDVTPSPRHNQSLGSGNGRRTASDQNTPASDNNDGSDQGNAGSNQLGIRHSQGASNGPANYGQQNQEQLDAATHMNNGSTNGVASSNAGSNSQQPANSFNGSRLPQTGERNDDMAAILMALGSSLSALGYAIEKRRRRYHMGQQANRFNNK